MRGKCASSERREAWERRSQGRYPHGALGSGSPPLKRQRPDRSRGVSVGRGDESALELFQCGVEVPPGARWALQGVRSTQIELDSMVIPASMILSMYFCQSASFASFS